MPPARCATMKPLPVRLKEAAMGEHKEPAPWFHELSPAGSDSGVLKGAWALGALLGR
ncbi:hypothetical protein GCM10009544_01180 [Streptomyces stramineus]|uniref:Uncharacterized protein n=1 Tax=Streptomyces stramineus TaxID=173861 RepID=A0ABN0ZBA0_9ACTN